MRLIPLVALGAMAIGSYATSPTVHTPARFAHVPRQGHDHHAHHAQDHAHDHAHDHDHNHEHAHHHPHHHKHHHHKHHHDPGTDDHKHLGGQWTGGKNNRCSGTATQGQQGQPSHNVSQHHVARNSTNGNRIRARRAWAEQSFAANTTKSSRMTPANHRSGPGKYTIMSPRYYSQWDFGPESSDVVYGTNVGNMFLIEPWMDGNWFLNLAPNAKDMWGLIQHLGRDRAKYELERHYDTWITRNDVRTMAQAHINHVRIPVGWWSFLPATPQDGWVYANDLYYLERLLGWLAEEGMFAILDLHSQVGGQSGDAATGRAQGTNYKFFTAYNQERADQVIHAVRDFVLGSRYGRVISSILPVNEPCVNTVCAGGRGNPDNYGILKDFYARTYDTLSYVGIPMLFHHGWAPGHLSNWTSFVQERDPSMIIASDNPYPGAFPAQTDENKIWSKMCYAINTFRSYPTKVISTEWSLSSGMPSSFESQFYNSQAWGYGLAGGGCFWSFKVLASKLQPAPDPWSWIASYRKGIVPTFDQFPPWEQDTQQMLASLQNKHVCRTW